MSQLQWRVRLACRPRVAATWSVLLIVAASIRGVFGDDCESSAARRALDWRRVFGGRRRHGPEWQSPIRAVEPGVEARADSAEPCAERRRRSKARQHAGRRRQARRRTRPLQAAHNCVLQESVDVRARVVYVSGAPPSARWLRRRLPSRLLDDAASSVACCRATLLSWSRPRRSSSASVRRCVWHCVNALSHLALLGRCGRVRRLRARQLPRLGRKPLATVGPRRTRAPTGALGACHVRSRRIHVCVCVHTDTRLLSPSTAGRPVPVPPS